MVKLLVGWLWMQQLPSGLSPLVHGARHAAYENARAVSGTGVVFGISGCSRTMKGAKFRGDDSPNHLGGFHRDAGIACVARLVVESNHRFSWKLALRET